ncbi:archaellin/type IV pilin N-terminal domain-containing protein [Halalkalirubrum salinum]|uniref:archaellin/type IV pilin N-terminal domain-containing protein n=1 Tax=Halalkalirubrum salinum TaxID=2563889 RepID=UPI0010FB8856|nr:archaellin/type IV pilin N-terminal domain-containing protein [Halalkalirubrum salinum]
MTQQQTDRGQVGIGTLIVFIAMVLVAAIAAGVLINTAGFLQSQAEATGEESSAQVTDRVQVITTLGSDSNDDGELDHLNLTVSRAAGANEINLEQAIVEITGPDGFDTVAHDSGFTTTAVTDSSDTRLDNRSDRIRLDLDLDAGEIGNVDPVSESEELTIKITTASGATTTEVARAPETIDDGETVEL